MNATVNRVHLPVRIPMRPDEWPETYLISLARAQGIRRPNGSAIELIRSALPWEHLPSTGIRPSIAPPPHTQGRPRYGGESLPLWASMVRSAPLRYCPQCLAEARYFRTRWRLVGLHACTLHGCFLKSDLFEEAISAYYGRDRWTTVADADDARILDAALCCLPDELHVAKMVWQPLEVLTQTASNPWADKVLTSLVSWSVLLWRFIDAVSLVHHQQVIHEVASGPLARAGRFVKDLDVVTAPSEEGVLALFEGLRENAHVRTGQRFLERLVKQEEAAPTALSSLPLRYLSERLMAISPQVLRITASRPRKFREIHEHAVSRTELMQQLAPLGAGYKTIDRLLQCNRIPSMKVMRGGSALTFIERKHALQARRALLSLISVRDFIAQHDLDWRTYMAIRDTALIRTGLMHEFLYRQDISALIARLELMSAPEHESRDPVWRLFRETTVGMVGGSSLFFDVVQAAIQGQIKVYRDLSKPGLSAFSIGIDGIGWAVVRSKIVHRARVVRPAQAQRSLFDAQEAEVTA